MSAAPDVVHPQKHDELGDSWNNSSSIRTKCMKLTLPQRQIIAEGLSTGDVKVRKPYTITKQRERWTELEHQKFLEALKLYGRAWQRIEEHIGTKTAVQIRSHAQKVFSKLERGVPTGKSAEAEDIDIPPPRPKRKPSHPYPKKAVYNACVNEVNKHPTSSSSEIVAKTEPVGFTPYTGNRGAELGASAEAHPHNQNDGVKLFAKPVIVPKAQKLAAPINHLPRENVSESTCIQINKAKSNAGFLPFVGLQKGLTPVSIQCTVLHTDQNSGTITEEGCTDESREVACTNTGSNAKYEANGMDYESTSCAETHKDAVDHIKNGKVDSVSNKDPAKALKSDPHNSTDYLFSYYTGAQHKPQGSLDGSLASPMLFWHFLQTAALNNPFQYATIGSWTELTGSVTQKCGNDIHFLPSYSGGASFASSWNFRGSNGQGQQDSISCERVPRSTLGVCRIEPMKSSECTTEMKEHRLKPISISGIAEESNVINHKRNNVHLGNGNGNTIPDIEIHQDTGLIKQSDDEFDDIVKDARNHAEQSFSTSIDEFDEGNGKKKSNVDGSSSGSNNPLEGCQVSEVETPDNLQTNKKYNEKNTNPEESHSGTRGCPKVRFKHIEKRKRYQQRDLKNGSTEDHKRPKGYPHDVDSWKEVSEEGRKAFRALFTGKTLPQTFPKNGTLDGYLHTQNPDKDCDGIMAHGPVLKVVKEEENTKNVAKFSVSSRSGFVPYQRAKPEVTCTV